MSPFEPDTWQPPYDAVVPITQANAGGVAPRVRYHSFFSPHGDGPWDAIRQLAALPFFARLNYIKQLSTTNIGLNLEATHNRLAHLLGTLDVCATMMQSFCLTASDDALLPEPAEAVATLLFAFLHDSYHGPFGHSLDRIGDVVLSDEGQTRIDKALLNAEIVEAARKTGDLWDLVLFVARTTGSGPWKALPTHKASHQTPEAFALSIVRFLRLLTSAPELARVAPARYWLRELVDSQIDSDRIDYVLRDSHALRRVPPFRERDIDDLVKGARIAWSQLALPRMEMGEEMHLEQCKVARVHWPASQETTVEEFLSFRGGLYRDVYEAPEKRSLDEMLVHALIWLCSWELAPDGGEPSQEQIGALLRQLVYVTDDELFHYLYEIGTRTGFRIPVALVHDVAVGRPFVEVWRRGIAVESLDDAAAAAAVLFEECEKAREALLREYRLVSGATMLGLDLTPGLKSLLDKCRAVLPGIPNEAHEAALLFCLERNYGRSFRRREQLEGLVWNRLLATPDGAVRDLLVKELWALHSGSRWDCDRSPSIQNADDLLAYFRPFPLVFLSIPWVPPHGVKNVELAEWARELDVLFHQGAAAVSVERDLPRRRRQSIYPISVFLPGRLASHERIVATVDDLMQRLIYSLVWLYPERARPEGYEWWAVDLPPVALSFSKSVK